MLETSRRHVAQIGLGAASFTIVAIGVVAVISHDSQRGGPPQVASERPERLGFEPSSSDSAPPEVKSAPPRRQQAAPQRTEPVSTSVASFCDDMLVRCVSQGDALRWWGHGFVSLGDRYRRLFDVQFAITSTNEAAYGDSKSVPSQPGIFLIAVPKNVDAEMDFNKLASHGAVVIQARLFPHGASASDFGKTIAVADKEARLATSAQQKLRIVTWLDDEAGSGRIVYFVYDGTAFRSQAQLISFLDELRPV